MTTAELVSELRAYFARHENARDTAEGAARWWLGHLAVSADDVQTALDALVVAGELEAVPLPDGKIVYGRRCR